MTDKIEMTVRKAAEILGSRGGRQEKLFSYQDDVDDVKEAARVLGKIGGKIGGKVRARNLSKQELSDIGFLAAVKKKMKRKYTISDADMKRMQEVEERIEARRNRNELSSQAATPST